MVVCVAWSDGLQSLVEYGECGVSRGFISVARQGKLSVLNFYKLAQSEIRVTSNNTAHLLFIGA